MRILSTCSGLVQDLPGTCPVCPSVLPWACGSRWGGGRPCWLRPYHTDPHVVIIIVDWSWGGDGVPEVANGKGLPTPPPRLMGSPLPSHQVPSCVHSSQNGRGATLRVGKLNSESPGQPGCQLPQVCQSYYPPSTGPSWPPACIYYSEV